jgi:DNA polymerase III alpha subunit
LIKAGALDMFEDRKVLLANTETLIERSKSSQSTDAGLFGMMEMVTKVTLKPAEKSTMMERLMLEYEVFKVFVS